MWLYIKQLLQLLLEPSHGWEDISEANRPAETIQRTGFFPWIGITSLSCFARLIYEHDLTFIHVLQTAIAVAGDPVRMARAFAQAVVAGREAYEAGLGAQAQCAEASSPLTAFLD